MEIAAFKVKSRNLLVLTFGHSILNIWSYRSPIVANSFFFIHDSKVYKRSKFQPKPMSSEFYQQTGFVKKRVQITIRSI